MSYTDFANIICHKTQKAAKAMIQARITANSLETLLPTANVFGGMEGSAVTAKRVVCLCQNAVTAENDEANWMADLTIQVICPYSDIAEDDFHELAGQMFAFFFQGVDTTATRLSNADVKYTAQRIFPRSQRWELGMDANGDPAEWVSELAMQVLCSGSVIA